MQVIKLSENKLREMLGEAVKYVLKESMSQRAYHFTSMYALLNIVDSNTFKCSPSYNDGSRQMYDTKEYPYFFSTTRVKDGRFGYSNSFDVRIELNADMFNAKYKTKPYNFFGKRTGESEKQMYIKAKDFDYVSQYQYSVENEDRVFVRTPYIQNAMKYIKRVDILLPVVDLDELHGKQWFDYRDLLFSPIGGKIVFYNNEDEFNRQGNVTVTDEIRDRIGV